MEKHKERLQFDSQICPKATIKDIDRQKLKWFLRKANVERNLGVEPETPIKEALNRLNLIQKGSINRREYIELNQISHTIAHKEIRELVAKGILKKIGAGKYIRYELTQG